MSPAGTRARYGAPGATDLGRCQPPSAARDRTGAAHEAPDAVPAGPGDHARSTGPDTKPRARLETPGARPDPPVARLDTPVARPTASSGRDRSTGLATSSESGRDRSTGLATSSESGRDWSTGLATSSESGRDRPAGGSTRPGSGRDRHADPATSSGNALDQPMHRSIHTCPPASGPVIARVRDRAPGGGFERVLARGLATAAERAVRGLPEARPGPAGAAGPFAEEPAGDPARGAPRPFRTVEQPALASVGTLLAAAFTAVEPWAECRRRGHDAAEAVRAYPEHRAPDRTRR
ncbi:hypothetical protein AB0G32_08430 [Streptomyces sp. NPDC023723]|uniref:hypothetical protein n=1 Tax=Streptomyces sp. NPDC023723 TaxID=3154323 RepID=UPI003401CE1A